VAGPQETAYNLSEWNGGEEVRMLVVDDDPAILELLERIFNASGCRCVVASEPRQARQHFNARGFDIIFCDVKMRSQNGIDFGREVLEQFPDTAIVMMSGADDPERIHEALEIGAYGYIVKPFQISEIMINAAGALRRRTLEMQSRRQQDILERRVLEESLKTINSLDRLKEAFEGITEAMGLTIEARDPYTAGHQRKVSEIASAIGIELGLSKDQVEGVRIAGLIHDIGKISVPAEILAKPSNLSEYEFLLIKDHPKVGYEILKNINFPWPVAETIYQHHERLDGSGYPHGLFAEDILLEAKILAVADVVEAMAAHRPYRPSFGIKYALDEINRKQGLLYDSEAVKSCMRAYEKKAFVLNERQ
jgi:putative two-component system response regulator